MNRFDQMENLKLIEKLKVVRCLFVFILGLFLGFQNALAASSYNIDGYYSVMFPGSPEVTGEIGEGADRYKSYNYTDENNFIVYTATYQVGKRVIDQKNIHKALLAFAKGNSMAVAGEIVSSDKVEVDGYSALKYKIHFKVNGADGIKHAIVAYSNGHLLSWSVQEFVGYSKVSGQGLFDKYVNSFSMK